ncbi:MAG: hypothetical protein KDD19_00310 [Phaeodactylibacter sp.]|nr:hypothetical protein [Phaeodactylibacter sp.]
MKRKTLIFSCFLTADSDPENYSNWTSYKNAAVLMASCMRYNRHARYFLFTNDLLFLHGMDRLNGLWLSKLGVEFKALDSTFPPSSGGGTETEYHYSKLDAFAQVASLRMDCCIFLGLDCVWIGSSNSLEDAVIKMKIPFALKIPAPAFHRVTTPEPGMLRPPPPAYYSSEFLAAIPSAFRQFTEEAHLALNTLNKAHTHNGSSLKIAPPEIGQDNEEYLMNYILNFSFPKTADAKAWAHQVDNIPQLYVAIKKGPVLHLPAFRDNGIRNLFNGLVHRDSAFWTSSLTDFPDYVLQCCLG